MITVTSSCVQLFVLVCCLLCCTYCSCYSSLRLLSLMCCALTSYCQSLSDTAAAMKWKQFSLKSLLLFIFFFLSFLILLCLTDINAMHKKSIICFFLSLQLLNKNIQLMTVAYMTSAGTKKNIKMQLCDSFIRKTLEFYLQFSEHNTLTQIAHLNGLVTKTVQVVILTLVEMA